MGANLITLEEYKASENISKLENDSRIESFISHISQLVKTYCANSFVDYVNTDKVETFSIEDDISKIQLNESPLISVTKVEERSSYGTAYAEITAAAFEFYPEFSTDTIHRTTSSGIALFPKGPGSVQITYKAGYDPVPDDLKLAAFDLINYYMKDEHKPRRTIGGSSLSNDPSSTQWRNVSFPDHIKRVLDLYKLVKI